MKGYKTIAFNVIMAGIALIHAFNTGASLPDASAVSGVVDQFSTWFDSAMVVGNVILRAITTTSVFKKE
jgi:hypothetical protein